MQKAIFTLLLFSCLQANAQNIGIGTTTPAASAQLEISSTNKGLLIPRMTTAQRKAIASPVVGLQIFNLDDQCTDIYDGANWIKNCGLKVISTTTDPGHPTSNSWTQKANFGGIAREGGVGFSIGSKGYIGTGASPAASKDFWEYTPATNTWAQKANVGGNARSYAIGFSIGTKGYIGTGQSSGQPQNDFWEYNPATNVWTQKANIGVVSRYEAVGFSIGSKGYVGIGFNGFYQNDFWEYDPSTDAWTPKATFPGFRSGAVGFSIGSKGYVGTGYQDNNYKNDFWEYDPASNTWVQKANFGGDARFRAVGFSTGNKGYIGTGIGSGYKNDFWEYDPASNTWIQKAEFGGTARKNAVGFAIGNRGFLGTGGTSNFTYSNDFWEYLDNNIYTTYSANTISSENNTVTYGAWTLANSTVYNANSGNVGIGTTNPANKLSVTGNADISGNVGIGTANPANKLSVTGNADFSGNVGVGTTNPANKLSIIGNADISGNVGIGTANPANKLSVTGNADFSGNVGVGTANPANKLSVTGNADFSGNVGVGTANPANKLSIVGNADISGNVGIGTSTPLARLQIISGTSAPALRLDVLANTSAFSMSGTGSFNIDAVGIIGGRMIVKDDGKVGIGTNAPTELLDINGTLKAQTLNANAWKTQSTTANGYANMGGILMQWGTVDYKENNNKTVTYPVAFTEVFSVTLTLDNNNVGSNGGNIPPKLWRVENSYFELGGTQVFSGGLNKVRWMAVGR